MPHEVETMAFAGATPWHGLGTALAEEDTTNWEVACAKAGLDWDVETVPLVTADKQEPVTHVAVRRSSDNRVLGVVGARYVPVQNEEAFKWFQPFLEAGEATLHTAGSLRSGSRVWVLAKLDRDPIEIVPGDEIEKFLLLSHSHDGSLAVRCGFTPIRVVCANTLAMAQGSDASKLIRVRHTGDVLGNLSAIREVMNLADQEFQATADQYRLLARKQIHESDLRRYVKRVLRVEDDTDLSGRTRNIVERIVGLAEAGRGNDLASVRGTYWAAFNGLTEWTSHERGRSAGSRLDSLWYGDSAGLNKHALEVALDMAA